MARRDALPSPFIQLIPVRATDIQSFDALGQKILWPCLFMTCRHQATLALWRRLTTLAPKVTHPATA